MANGGPRDADGVAAPPCDGRHARPFLAEGWRQRSDLPIPSLPVTPYHADFESWLTLERDDLRQRTTRRTRPNAAFEELKDGESSQLEDWIGRWARSRVNARRSLKQELQRLGLCEERVD